MTDLLTNAFPTLPGGRFEIRGPLGAGGMGEVFLGYDRRDAQLVAIKRLLPAAAADAEAVQRFAREGALLRAAAHPHIVQVLAVLEDDPPAIVMEYVAGGTLEGLLARERALPVARALGIALDLSDALARAHRLGIIHRDLKPANVLLAEDGSARLSDFGIASMHQGQRLTETGMVVGTMRYLAPERWDGTPADVRADVWAFGVMLYEALAGVHPFSGVSPVALMHAIMTAEVPPLHTVRQDVPRALSDAIDHMLAKDPLARMGSVRELGVVAEQLLHGHATTVRSAAVADGATVDPRWRLPRASSPLIGREALLHDVTIRLTDEHTRLVTLSGPGGTGKTRVAIEAARKVSEAFPDGVFYLDLTGLTDPSHVLPMVAQALGVEEDLYRPLDELLALRLADARVLLVLDNFEQLLPAAGSLALVLTHAVHARMLVTSRFVLRVADEDEVHVPPLACGARAAADASSDAVHLFLDRARAADRRFAPTADDLTTIADICQRLDGLPLAIELAAARIRVLPPARLQAQLEAPLRVLTSGERDRAPHQRALGATIEWSWRLLSTEEQMLFHELSVFHGGWSLEDADAVSGAGAGRDLLQLVDGLQSLVEKSFLAVERVDGDPRYRMLQTLQAFASAHREADPITATVCRRHAEWFLAMAEQADADIPTPAHAEALQRLLLSHDNVRAALAWLFAEATPEAVRMAAALGQFWYLTGHWSEALAWNARVLTLSAGSPVDRARVLDHHARLEMFLGDESAAMAHHRDAVALAAQISDRALRVQVAEGYAEVLLKVGDTPAAIAVLHRAEEEGREAPVPPVLADVLTTLATAYVGEGNHARAEQLLAEARAMTAERGDQFLMTKICYYLAGIALLRDDAKEARSWCVAGREASRRTGDTAWTHHLDEMEGRSLIADGGWAEAYGRIRGSLQAFHAVGSRSCLPHSFEAAARLRLALPLAGEREETWREAMRLLGAADALCRTLAIAMLPVERALFQQTRSRAAALISAADAVHWWAEGAALPEDAVLALGAAAPVSLVAE